MRKRKWREWRERHGVEEGTVEDGHEAANKGTSTTTRVAIASERYLSYLSGVLARCPVCVTATRAQGVQQHRIYVCWHRCSLSRAAARPGIEHGIELLRRVVVARQDARTADTTI